MNPHPLRFLARVTIELTSPLHIGTGRPSAVADVSVVTDANGLPAIPGTSLAGALRAAFEASPRSQEAAKNIFGWQERDQGCGSRLSISWGILHNSKNEPVNGLRDPATLDDPVLGLARDLPRRDHVRLSHRGVSDSESRGKFDELCVHIGHRFTFEMELAGSEADADHWKNLLDFLKDPRFRLGGKSRRGFGSFNVVDTLGACFDLRTESGFKDYIDHPADLSAGPTPALAQEKLKGLGDSPPPRENGVVPFRTLRISPRGYWMFGPGTDLADQNPADMASYREAVVIWNSEKAEVERNCLIIPGSAVKGALAHRVAFHHNRRTGRFLKTGEPDSLGQVEDPTDCSGENNEAVRALFGYVKGKEGGQRGCVLIDDVTVRGDPKTQRIPHVSLDRFTGGALPGFLFDERPVHGLGCLPFVEITVWLAAEIRDPHILGALCDALNDLEEGRLALGGGTGRGHGYFEKAPETADHKPPR